MTRQARKTADRKTIALIGYGRWGKILLPYLLEQFEVTAIYGRSLNQEGIKTNDLEEAIASAEAVFVATPMDTHFKIAKRALKARKHVMCEKPLTLKSSEIEELCDLAETGELHLLTDYTYVFSPGLRRALGIVNRDLIGELKAVEMSLKYVGKEPEFDIHWLFSSHMLAVLDMFVSVDMLSFKKHELMPGNTEQISFAGDHIHGNICVSANHPESEKRIVFYGDKGTIIYDAINPPSIKYIDKMTGHPESYHYDEANNLRYAVGFFDAVLRKGYDGSENLRRAMRVTAVLERL